MGKRGLAFGSAWRLSPWEDWGPSALESLEVGLEAPPCGVHWKWRWRPFVGALQRCPSYDMAVFCPLKAVNPTFGVWLHHRYQVASFVPPKPCHCSYVPSPPPPTITHQPLATHPKKPRCIWARSLGRVA